MTSRSTFITPALLIVFGALSFTSVLGSPGIVQTAEAEINRAEPPKANKRKRKYVHPCPAGTEAYGEAPPNGGKIYCRQPIVGGHRNHGGIVSWYGNGEKRFEGEYMRGKKHGAWTIYHRNGEKKAVEEWYDGKRVRKHRFDRNGKVVEEKDKDAERRKKRKRYKWRNNMKH